MSAANQLIIVFNCYIPHSEVVLIESIILFLSSISHSNRFLSFLSSSFQMRNRTKCLSASSDTFGIVSSPPLCICSKGPTTTKNWKDKVKANSLKTKFDPSDLTKRIALIFLFRATTSMQPRRCATLISFVLHHKNLHYTLSHASFNSEVRLSFFSFSPSLFFSLLSSLSFFV